MIHKIISAKQVLFMNKCSLKHGSFLLSFVTPAYIEFKNSKIRVVFFFSKNEFFSFVDIIKCAIPSMLKKISISKLKIYWANIFTPQVKKKPQSKKGNNSCWFIKKNLRGDDLVIVCSRGW